MSNPESGAAPNYFGSQAERYAAHRPAYPLALFHYLAVTSRQTQLVWDCATGNGQAAMGLVVRFARVVATDASREMLAQAPPHPRITYREARYDSGLPSGSCDLVTVAQALHWLDLDPLLAEVRRVLGPRGVFAAWCYSLCRVAPEIDEVMDVFYRVTLGPYWPAQRRHVDDGYRALALPLDEVVVPPFVMSQEWLLTDLARYVRTWSAVGQLRTVCGDEPLVAFEDALRSAWGHPGLRRRVTFPFSFRIGHLR